MILKFSALPTEPLTTDKTGSKTFLLDVAGMPVRVTLRPKLWQKLEQAAKDWPSWVAALSGQMGPREGLGFVLLEPNVQVFERKAKAATPTGPGAGT